MPVIARPGGIGARLGAGRARVPLQVGGL